MAGANIILFVRRAYIVVNKVLEQHWYNVLYIPVRTQKRCLKESERGNNTLYEAFDISFRYLFLWLFLLSHTAKRNIQIKPFWNMKKQEHFHWVIPLEAFLFFFIVFFFFLEINTKYTEYPHKTTEYPQSLDINLIFY